MKLYNTLARRVENFKPRQSDKVNLFVCGPTVYDFAQLGNAKTYTQMDLLARVLRDHAYEVFYLQNITDIDDKIIARAQEKNVGWEELRNCYEVAYKRDMEALNNTSVTEYARATDYIDDIIRQVQVLMDKDHAYRINDGIYYEVSSFPGYGKLSGRTNVQKDDAQTRIDHSDEKKGWNDFCLWKFSKPGEPEWDAPFGRGRPGWHIEDTAITEHHFGPQYDIHGAAVDLIFPHHEAEITQMESASGKVPFVKYWVHGGFLTVDGTRMGKSMGNFVTIRDVLAKSYDPMALRLLMLQTHYRSPINFSWANLDAAANRLNSLRFMADHKWQSSTANTNQSSLIAQSKASIHAALAEDLNVAQALATLSKLEGKISRDGISTSSQEAFGRFLIWLDSVLGLKLSERSDITAAQKVLVQERESARAKNDWVKSDMLREELEGQGLAVHDTAHGPIWSRL